MARSFFFCGVNNSKDKKITAQSRDLSAPQRTMRASIASVEMTILFGDAEKNKQRQGQPQVLRLRNSQVRELLRSG